MSFDTLPLTHRITPGAPALGLDAYQAAHGYAGLRAALAMAPDQVVSLVKDAGLRGRGGAGFPTGLKWSFVPQGDKRSPGSVYLVCNCDEMEPGTFKDRFLIEHDPHLLVEGVLIAAYAIQADVAYIFMRGEYHQPAAALRQAMAEAAAAGFSGNDILGSGWDCAVHLHLSGGRYICGEETALLNALEGKRATPRSKPPFPPASGLFGRPTVVNNVETLCNVPAILAHDDLDWYRGLSAEGCEDAGTKLFGVSGRVKHPGLWELPMGTTLREIIFEHAGGMQDGYRLRGLLPGGASTDFLVEEHLDLAMDYATIQQAGSRMGTGTITVMDDSVCPVDMARNLQHFFAQESCGFCTPCREGLPWLERVLADIEAGRGFSADYGGTAEEALAHLDAQAQWIGAPGNTFCLHATGAIEPLASALKYFRTDFEEHLATGRCKYRSGEHQHG